MGIKASARMAAWLIIVLGLTGCWDLKEPNELSFVMGSGWDAAEDGAIKVSVQIPVLKSSSSQSAGGGAPGKPYTVVTASGKNISDAALHIQEKLSRALFPGHRIALFISEEVAKRGFTKWLDELIRNPDSNTRVSIFVVKGVSAERFLGNEYAMERFSSLYATRTTKIAGFTENIFDLQKDKNNPSKCFLLPIITAISGPPENQLEFQDIAVFDQDGKLSYSLKREEASLALWITGKITHIPLTLRLPKEDGTISLDLQKIKRKIKVKTDGKQIKVSVKLTGTGLIRENNTKLYLLSPAVKDRVTGEMSDLIRKQAIEVIQTVQKKYKTDIFGIGNELAWKHPAKWQALRGSWPETFSQLDVSVDVKLKIDGVGQVGTGPQI
ncbi:Ger(x)C family spore germination protein [Paenibacillus silvisoli]|uniref:Ger(x)C family spore germination protein n=1 Tax=Paenibacillus silvisoli TaxID=3110539 RepID=UPI00280470BA|nr:Ger(x)C family spore germination protein [Paenibacillus silvisoli]